MSCDCSSEPQKLLYACSGAANVGLLADQVSRKLARDGYGSMTCMAAVACGAKIFQKYGLECRSVILTNYGPKKGETEITADLIDQIAAKIQEAPL